ncbi:MAG TPA: FAD-dependent oxidoreductase [Bacillota bacterium]|nr:FAD-dependent oxidoreductase [Bacillota bacterium]
MKRKWFIWLLGVILIVPIVIFGWWKSFEWVTMHRLKNLAISVQPYTKEIKDNQFDVIVVGGEPEGVAAAVSAARNGAKTLLVEKRDGLGGLITYGMLNYLDYDRDKNGQIANAGIFEEWHKMVGDQVTVDIETAKNAFMGLVQKEPNITLSLNSTVVKPLLSTDLNLNGIVVKDESGEHTYYAKRFIDSTQDADLAEIAGVPYFIGNEDIGLTNQKMSSTLMLHFKNVEWDGVVEAALTKKFGVAGITPTAAWGFGDIRKAYKPSQPDVRLRGLNIARQSDNSVYINALQIFNVNGLDPSSLETARQKGEKETKNILEFLRKEFPGFKNAEIASIPSELYVRETRHIKAEYQLPITDVWENKDQWDSIGFGAYPCDIQATSADNTGFIMTDPTQYAIPFRSLVPLHVGHLLVASKASGYASLAAGSARIIPTGMTTAQAAGAASALSIQNNIDFREMSKDKSLIEALQGKLKDQGALLYHYEIKFPYEGEWYYPAIKELLTYGLIVGGHENRFAVDQPMKDMAFVNILANGLDRVDSHVYTQVKERLTQVRYMAKETPLTRDQAATFILHTFGYPKSDQPWTVIKQKGILDQTIVDRLNENKELSTAEGYSILSSVLQHLDQIDKVKGTTP